MVAPDAILEREGASCAIWLQGPSWEGASCAALGRLTGTTPEAVSSVLEAALSRLVAHGCKGALAPMDGATWFSYRAVTEPGVRPPFLMEPAANPAVLGALRRAGFGPAAEYVSAVAPLDRLRRGIAGSETIRLRPFDLGRVDAELGLLHRLSCAGFARNAFYTPLSEAAFRALYAPLLPALDPDFLLFAEDATGEALGFAFALPNHAEGPTPRALVLKTYAALKPGIGAILADAIHRRARARGFVEIIHALMHADNRSLAHSRLPGAQIFRRYALFAKRLTA